MVHLFFIKTFVAVAKTGSFRSAAIENNITQPAVSQHIRQLENRLNCKLFERTAKKIMLTEAGKIFLTSAEELLKLYENAKSQIEELSSSSTGSIRIASIYSMGLYLLKPVMQHFLKEYPGINIQLEYRQNERIYEMVRNDTVDFGLVALPEQKPGLTIKVFAFDKLLLVQSRQHPFFKRKHIELAQLDNVKMVGLDPKTPTGRMILEFLHTREISPDVIKKSDNIETLKNAVEIGMGCAILPESTLGYELKNKIFDKIAVTGLNLTRPLAILYNSKKTFNRPSRLFYEMLTQNALA